MSETVWLALGGTAVSVLTVLLTKGIDAYVKFRKANSEEEQVRRAAESEACHLEDERADRVYSATIADQSARIERLETGYTALRKEHEVCLQTAARQSAEIQSLERDTKRMQDQIETLMRDKTSREAAKE